MDGVGTSIIGRPRPLSRHRRADDLYTLNCEEPVIRDGDMKQTVRETTVEKKYNPETGEEISTVTTRYMMDGSRYVETVNAKASFSDRSPLTTVVHFDKDNKQISRTETVTWKPWAPSSLAGKTTSTTTYADGTIAELEQLPNGEQFVTIRTPDAREPNVPINLTDHPVLSTVSAAGGKYLGPGVAVATALWDYHVADSDFKKCVAAAEGIRLFAVEGVEVVGASVPG
ncbi:hypothetical protein [Mycolicibacterium smegmatis]|uniref:hypothetical protein n=1 Tax=Mycolicibacterium smegmatis TaxID=1772 RepID=UPI001EFB2715|nr:hypothetical protein [Mycolicibacterium smegmatis]ULN70059.1 hypothetical protein KZ782_31645 [Mycolicibacterium smegmatis]